MRTLLRPHLAFSILLISFSLSAFHGNIWDCDESMNYWEPTHYLLYNYGLQTWEYCPVYALRSYFYLELHALWGRLTGQFLQFTKIQQYYLIRTVLASLAALACTYLSITVLNKYGDFVALITFLQLVVAPGMFISVSSFLPSTFSMICMATALAAWLDDRLAIAELMVALSTIVAWPFSALVGLPIAVDILRRRGILFGLRYGILALALFLLPSVIVDTYYYGKFTVAMWNIIDYNVLSRHLHGGSELYGVEPWYYYLINSFLNFNVMAIFALLSAPLMILDYLVVSMKYKQMPLTSTLLYLSGFYLWLIYMSLVPHKEERFLYVVYPHLCFAGALGLKFLPSIANYWTVNVSAKHQIKEGLKLLVTAIVLAFIVLSLSRIGSLYMNYNTSMRVYQHINDVEAQTQQDKARVNLCVGEEWYRFPSHFFLPNNWRLQFVKSSFGGQLPQYFSEVNGTRIILPNFNDRNLEEPSRYVELSQCDYFVGQINHEVNNATFPPSEWKIVFSEPFLNAAKSPRWSRAFYIPWISRRQNVYNNYVLLKRQRAEH